jgi:hypothetical protein
MAYCFLQWVLQLGAEIEVVFKTPVELEGDCRPAQGCAEAPGSNRSKMVHVDTAGHKIYDGIKGGEIMLKWVSGEECSSDMLTKALGPKLFERFKRIVMGGWRCA